MILSPADIHDLAAHRTQQFAHDHARFKFLSQIYHGQHQQLYPDEFVNVSAAPVTGLIRRSWNMFARKVGKVPDIRVAPLSLTDKEQSRADRIEKICFGYNHIWDAKRKFRAIAHYLVGMGAVGAGIMPHPKNKTPMLLVEDPRNILPGPGFGNTSLSGMALHHPGNDSGGSLDDCIVRKTITGRQLRRMWPGVGDIVPDTHAGMTAHYTILQYYDDTHVMSVLEGYDRQLGAAVEHNIGWCPWSFICSFAPDSNMGTSDFEQQVGLEVAFMRMIDQKLSLNDAVIFPWLARKGLWEDDPAKRLMEASSTDAEAQFLTPPATFQVDRDVQLMREIIRSLNMETEASEGNIKGGPITGRGIVELSSPTIDTIQSFFDDLGFYLPRLYTSALMCEVNMWPDEVRTVSGYGRGETFFTEYTPAKDIGTEFGGITVEYGPGVGGFEGHLQLLQSIGADTIDVTTVMENNPHIRSVTTIQRRMVVDKLRTLLLEQGLSGQAAVPLPWIADAIQAISKGADPYEWFAENPPEQATATPEGVGPVPPGMLPPELQNQGPLPGSFAGPTLPPQAVTPPPLEQLLGLG